MSHLTNTACHAVKAKENKLPMPDNDAHLSDTLNMARVASRRVVSVEVSTIRANAQYYPIAMPTASLLARDYPLLRKCSKGFKKPFIMPLSKS